MTPFPLVLLWVRFPTLDSTASCLCVPWPAFLGLLCVLLQKALALCVSAAFKSLFPSLTRSHTPGKVEVLKLIQGTFSSTSCSVLSFFFFFFSMSYSVTVADSPRAFLCPCDVRRGWFCDLPQTKGSRGPWEENWRLGRQKSVFFLFFHNLEGRSAAVACGEEHGLCRSSQASQHFMPPFLHL